MEQILWDISETGNVTQFDILKDSNFNINIYNKASFSPLQNACSKGYVHCVQLFLEHKADVNRQDHYGATPLSIACDENQIECVQILLDSGAKITPAMIICACNRGYLDIVSLLEVYQDINCIKEPVDE
jgi:uncharacterized protein